MSDMARCLCAPDSFKGTLSASVVAQALAAGARDQGWETDECPAGDGGEGTLDALLQLAGAATTVRARDPYGRWIDARLGLMDARTAVVEMAEASGLARVADQPPDPEAAGTEGTGDMILEARDAGAQRILVTVGGSATTDGGAGAVEAIRAGGGLGGARLEILCDVTTPFENAPAVFGPQKGADAGAIGRLRARLDALAVGWPRDPRGVPGTGCAGGLSGGLWANFGAVLHPGADAVLDALDYDRRVAECDVVLTGEGRLDEQTLEGKLVAAVARRANRLGRPVHALVGQHGLAADGIERLGLASVLEAGTREGLRVAARTLLERQPARPQEVTR